MSTKVYKPTLHPHSDFNAESDAEELHKAMKGRGTDEKAIIAVLAKRTESQRLEIVAQYQRLYVKDLLKELKGETSGDFKKLLLALVTPLPEFYAQELHEALSGVGTKESVLIEILCTTTNQQINAIKAAYQKLYSKSLEQDIKSDTSGDFERLLLSLCNAQRDETDATDESAAEEDAKRLYEAGEAHLGTNETTFVQVFTLRNYEQLSLIFAKYEDVSKRTIEQVVKGEFSGSAQNLLLTIIKNVRDSLEYFAAKLHASMKGLGTNNRELIRLVVTRCEVDLESIKEAYEKQYEMPLSKTIKGDLSGDYLLTVLTLVGDA